MSNQHLQNSILEASTVIGKTWPLYSFVTSNPLSGYENLPFKEAVDQAKELLNARVFPETWVLQNAWDRGDIKEHQIKRLLADSGFMNSPEFYLQQLASHVPSEKKNPGHELDRVMVKWLSLFLDEGLAEWEMPGKEQGFYGAWRALAAFDGELGIKEIKELPKTSELALERILKGISKEEYTPLFRHHLAALPGWTGYINHRITSKSLWQQAYPITLTDYLAVRLQVAHHLKLPLSPVLEPAKKEDATAQLQYIWLKAWENSFQEHLLGVVEKETTSTTQSSRRVSTPAAQMVFCIDTRSELIRRNVESKGDYETFGYAGFFGIAMDYTHLEDGITRKSCPPIVSSAYVVSESHQPKKAAALKTFTKKNERFKFGEYFLKRMKNMLPSAFGYVEGSGVFYGISTLMRTLAPRYLYKVKAKNTTHYEHFCDPQLHLSNATDGELQISTADKVAIVKSAFTLTGWKDFAPLVLFIGHGSHSVNNPFGSSLDCGACAASPGRQNARMLAKLANLPEVRMQLAENHNIVIPNSTLFIGAEHNTTTDEIVLFDAEVPESHQKQLAIVKTDLYKAQQTATQERLGANKNSISAAQQKANHWGETRPEWGLAKNAGFIIAPRTLTKHQNLAGRCFLHSYAWESDMEGSALEGILQGPMVVTQWINNHYYFSTVDNDTFGGGSKITHNITGKYGVVQGNGGDLKMGLPLQSVNYADKGMYHQPLRLSVLVQAPLERVNDILARNEHLKTLLDNEWIYLMVMDPLQEHEIMRYEKNLKWNSMSEFTLGNEKGASNIHTPIFDNELV